MPASRLRICLLCEDLSLPIDEGIKKFVNSIRRPLSQNADVLVLSVGTDEPVPDTVQSLPTNRFLISRRIRDAIRNFRPDAVIYVPIAAATRNSFLRCHIVRSYAPGARVIMVSLQPRTYGRIARQLIRRVHPDLTLVQSVTTSKALTRLGCPTDVLPSGVDLEAFAPVSHAVKLRLREKYGVPAKSYVVLHVGHLKRERNVLLLRRLHQELGYHTLVVGSTSTPSGVEDDVTAALEESGTQVINTYIETIAELYQMADCYLFPVHARGGAIEAPLSVLEAMGCDLPVVTTRFGFLTNSFNDGPGFAFADTDDELLENVIRMRQMQEHIRPGQVREQVLRFSWDAIADTLLDFTRADNHAVLPKATIGVADSRI